MSKMDNFRREINQLEHNTKIGLVVAVWFITLLVAFYYQWGIGGFLWCLVGELTFWLMVEIGGKLDD